MLTYSNQVQPFWVWRSLHRKVVVQCYQANCWQSWTCCVVDVLAVLAWTAFGWLSFCSCHIDHVRGSSRLKWYQMHCLVQKAANLRFDLFCQRWACTTLYYSFSCEWGASQSLSFCKLYVKTLQVTGTLITWLKCPVYNDLQTHLLQARNTVLFLWYRNYTSYRCAA